MKELNLSSCITLILLFQNKMYKEANIYAEVEFFPFVGVFFPYASNLLIPLAAHASFIIPSLVISY